MRTVWSLVVAAAVATMVYWHSHHPVNSRATDIGAEAARLVGGGSQATGSSRSNAADAAAPEGAISTTGPKLAGWVRAPRKMSSEQVVEQVLRAQGTGLVGEEVLLECRPEDGPKLVAAYKSIPVPSRRGQVQRAIAFAGGKEAFEALTYALFEEFAGQRLPLDRKDEEYLIAIAVQLGLLTTEDDDAYAIVVAGTHPDYWRARCKWSSDDPERAVGLLTSNSILALGMSGREDSREILMRLERECPGAPGGPSLSLNCTDAVRSALFYCDVVRDEGVDSMRGLIAGELEKRVQRYHRWRESAGTGVK